jgi:hypothetical protein
LHSIPSFFQGCLYLSQLLYRIAIGRAPGPLFLKSLF